MNAGYVQIALEDIEGAESSFQESLRLFTNLGDRDGQADSLRGMGDVYQRRHLLYIAEEHYRKAYRLYQTTGNLRGQSHCIFTLAEISHRSRQYARAEEEYRKALNLYEELALPEYAVRCRLQLADLAFQTERYSQAEEHYRQAVAFLHGHGRYRDEARCYLKLGEIGLRASRYDSAALLFKQALTLYRREGLIREQARALRRLGEISLYRSRSTEARRLFEEAISLFRRSGDIEGEAECLYHNGLISHRARNLPLADKLLREAARLYVRLGDINGEGNCYYSLGTSALSRKDRIAAARHLTKALRLFKILNHQDRLVEIHTLLARLDLRSGSPRRAGEHLTSALDHDRFALRENRTPEGAEMNRDLLLKQALGDLALHNPETALTLLETRRMNRLYRNLPRGTLLQAAGLRSGDRRRWKELRDDYARPSDIPRRDTARSEQREKRYHRILKEIREKGKTFFRFEEYLEKEYPRYALLVGRRKTDLREAARSLNREEAAVILLQGEKGFYAWIMTHPGDRKGARFLRFFRLPGKADEITALAGICQGPSREGSPEKLPAVRNRLSSMLLIPLLNLIPARIDSLYLIPEGCLNDLPWDTLPYKRQPLFMSRSVLLLPGLETLRALKADSRQYYQLPRAPVAAFGFNGPRASMVLSSGTAPLMLLKGEGKGSTPDKKPPALSPGGETPPREEHYFNRVEEARTVCSIYYGRGGTKGSSLYLDSRASKLALKGLKGHQILHMALMGDIVPESPETSRLQFFAPSDKGGPPREPDPSRSDSLFPQGDLLFPAEIIGLEIQSDLVILSGCRIRDRGRERHNGLPGFINSWIVTGSNGVLISLWPLPDLARKVFVTYYHRFLASGMHPRRALSKTQYLLLTNRWRKSDFAAYKTFEYLGQKRKYREFDFSSSYYWGSFQYWGR